jgi:cytochrome P450
MFEGLRISYGVSHRLQRIARDRTIKYHDWIIPVGTPVGLTAVHIHDDPDIFPSPREFRPERWLPLETTGLRLQEYLVSFSKGTRNCAGMNLAYAEFRVALAAVIRRFGGQMKLWDVVKERDVDAVTDAFAPLPTKAGRGIRVVL